MYKPYVYYRLDIVFIYIQHKHSFIYESLNLFQSAGDQSLSWGINTYRFT